MGAFAANIYIFKYVLDIFLKKRNITNKIRNLAMLHLVETKSCKRSKVINSKKYSAFNVHAPRQYLTVTGKCHFQAH